MKKALLVGVLAMLAVTSMSQAAIMTETVTDQAGWGFYPYDWGAWTAGKTNMNDATFIFKKFTAADLSGTITNAYLTITGIPNSDNDGVANGGSFLDIYAVTTNWSQGVAHSAIPGSLVATADSANYIGGTMNVDVTAAVQAWAAAGTQNGFAFQSRLPNGNLQAWQNDFNNLPSTMTLTIETASVPEPMTMALLALGGVGVLARRRAAR